MSRSPLILSTAFVLTGLALIAFAGNSLERAGQLTTSGNPFGLYRSAYGKLLARLAETTVDRVWHLGVEQVVPHYMTGDNHQAPAESKGEPSLATTRELPQRSLIEHSKAWVQKRVVSQYSRTNPYSLTEQHKDRVHRDIAKMLARSYKLDPTHYGAYNSYHLFITSFTLGGDEQSREFARELGRNTIELIQEEEEDAEAYLTAAAASMNLFLLETEDARINRTPIPLRTLKSHRNEIAGFLDKFETLRHEAEDRGDWDYVSQERQVEIMHRFRFTNKTFSQFDAMIARAEGTPAPGSEGEIVEKTE